MFKEYDRRQDYLLPPSLEELLPENDLSRLMVEIVEILDLSDISKKYSVLGQNAYHPQMMLALLFYAYSQGVFSSRKIAEHLQYDARFRYIAGNQHPDFRTISNFRKDNLPQIEALFLQIVEICQALGMVTLEHIALDGTRIKADASSKQMRKKEKIEQKLAETEAAITRILALAQEIDREEEACLQKAANETQLNDFQRIRAKLLALKAKLAQNPARKKINLTDPDCQMQKRAGPGYNGQIAVDAKSQVILAAEVVSDQNDLAQLLPMIEKMEANTKSQGKPKEVSADAGYSTFANYQALQENPHIDAYLPPSGNDRQKNKPQTPYDKYNFAFDPETKKCHCPQGQPMKLTKTGIKKGVKFYDFKGINCPQCPAKVLCAKKEFRTVRLTEADHLLVAMRQKLDTPYGKSKMILRSSSVEPVFGQIKEALGFRSFHLRGLPKVKGEFQLISMVNNIKKIKGFLKGKKLSLTLALSEKNFVFFLSRKAFYRLISVLVLPIILSLVNPLKVAVIKEQG